MDVNLNLKSYKMYIFCVCLFFPIAVKQIDEQIDENLTEGSPGIK